MCLNLKGLHTFRPYALCLMQLLIHTPTRAANSNVKCCLLMGLRLEYGYVRPTQAGYSTLNSTEQGGGEAGKGSGVPCRPAWAGRLSHAALPDSCGQQQRPLLPPVGPAPERCHQAHDCLRCCTTLSTCAASGSLAYMHLELVLVHLMHEIGGCLQ